MTRFVDIDRLSADLERAVSDALAPVDTNTPTIEDLLRRLAKVHAPARDDQRSFRFSSWAIAAAVLVSLCVPGGAAAAIFLMKSGNVEPPPREEQTLAKTDHLDRTEVAKRTDHSAEEKHPPVQETLNSADLLEPITFRGSIDIASATGSSPNPANPAVSRARRLKRNTVRTTPPPKLAEVPQPAPPPPSFLERLFGMNLSTTPVPPQT